MRILGWSWNGGSDSEAGKAFNAGKNDRPRSALSLRSACWVMSATISLLLFLFAQPMAATPSQPRIRVLILDGFSNHDWHQTTALLRGILEASGLFIVSVSTAPSTTASSGWEQWRPNFSDYDVVIQTCNDIGGGPSWPREVQIAFENYVRNGGGVLVFHSGNNAFPDWPVYNQMIGLGWRNRQQGDAITINSRERLLRIPS